MKILIISRYPPFPGGRENFVLELVQQLSKNNEVLVLTPDKDLHKTGSLTIKKYPRTQKKLEDVIRQFNPDIINSHTFLPFLRGIRCFKKIKYTFWINFAWRSVLYWWCSEARNSERGCRSE